MRCFAMAGVVAMALQQFAGCGASDPVWGVRPPDARAERFARCATGAGASVVTSPSDLWFASGTAYEAGPRFVENDEVSVGRKIVAAAFYPVDGEVWRIYAVAKISESDEYEPDLEGILRRAITDPADLDVVAVSTSASSVRPINKCIDGVR